MTRRTSSASTRPSRGALSLWLKRIGLTLLAGAAGLVLLGAAGYAYFSRDLPSVEALRTYRPPQVTKVTCADGSVCAEFFRERRTSVEIETLPAHVKNAFLAAEDADFYKHQGLDFWSLLRATLRSAGSAGQIRGASTITQQTCKNLLLTPERRVSRKLRELILAPRLEKALNKDEILELYLNQIYFGHGRYGIEEAGLYYFGKSAKDLNVGEAAVLAGLPQGPEYLNPVTNMVRAKKRQRYVLTQLERHGFAEAKTIAREMDKPILLSPRLPTPVGAYYLEEIRRTLVARYGDDAVLGSGMRIEIAMDPKLQRLAEEAVRTGLESIDRRMGYRGALGALKSETLAALRPKIATRLAEAGRRPLDAPLVADLSPLADAAPAVGEVSGAAVPETAPDPEASASREEQRARSVPLVPLRVGARLGGYVTAVNDKAQRATVDLISRTGQLTFSSLEWARPRGIGKVTPPPKKISDVLRPGQIVLLRVLAVPEAPRPIDVALDQIPEVQGAFIAIDPSSRKVVAMTGGYDFARSAFNRATQAKRQPGSSFKPFLYAAALGSGRYTPLTLVNDAPEAILDPYTGKSWKPHNYEKSGFEGPMTLRQALTKSKNTVSVRLIEALTPPTAIDFARRAGIRSPLPDNLTLALGTGEVSLLELTNAYATLRSLGQFAEPVLLTRVRDASGAVLEEHQAAFEETLPPPVAFLATSLMRSVVEEGTAMAVRNLNRPAAGKTGTASEYRDAWFAGYTAQVVAAAWVGFDNHQSLGTGETGGRAALPIWLEFMQGAHEGLPALDFDVPLGITLARVDPATGLLAGASVPGRLEPFLEGTAPTSETPPPGQLPPDQFLQEDHRRGAL
ncbi:MAG: penicillin-binding protein 1A [Myxococcaceae bacterium]